MTQKHTQEPWSLCEVENNTGRIKHLVPVDSEKLSILTIVENDQATFAAIYKDADARRIVACVNACAGFTTDELNDVVTHGGFIDQTRYNAKTTAQRDALKRELAQVEAAMKAQADGLVKQRDELLSVCMKAAEEIRKCDYTPARSTLLVAIYNAKGGTA